MSKELREPMADMEHDQWIHWMKYFIKLGSPERVEAGKFSAIDPHSTPVVVLVFDAEDWDRWMRQMSTQYHDLSEKEKDSDRKFADKMLDYLVQIGRLQG